MLRIPHCLDNQLTVGSEDVSLTRQLFYSPETFSGTCFSYKLNQLHGYSAARRKMEKFNDLIGTWIQRFMLKDKVVEYEDGTLTFNQ
jgi:hypothetical protein